MQSRAAELQRVHGPRPGPRVSSNVVAASELDAYRAELLQNVAAALAECTKMYAK